MSAAGEAAGETGRIELRGVRVLGRHGATADERRQPQPFEVDLDLDLDLQAAAATDDLAVTVDYAAVLQTVTATVQEESYQLLERLAHVVASRLAERFPIETVTVTVRKLRPPVDADVSTVGVRLVHRARQ